MPNTDTQWHPSPDNDGSSYRTFHDRPDGAVVVFSGDGEKAYHDHGRDMAQGFYFTDAIADDREYFGPFDTAEQAQAACDAADGGK